MVQIFSTELESQAEFNGFREWLHTFELFRGKKTGDADDDDSRIVGKFKVRRTVCSSLFAKSTNTIQNTMTRQIQWQATRVGIMPIYAVPLRNSLTLTFVLPWSCILMLMLPLHYYVSD